MRFSKARCEYLKNSMNVQRQPDSYGRSANPNYHGQRSQAPRKSIKQVIIKVMAYILLGAIGLGSGVFVYILNLSDEFKYVYTPFIDNGDYEPIDIGSYDNYDMNGDTASSWQDGGHTSVYVDPEHPIKKVKQKDRDVENILVFGVDARGSSDVKCRADAIMIVSIDKKTDTIKLISLMRDTGVTIEGRSKIDKLNHSYMYGGVGLLINTINDNFGFDIQRFVMLDFNSSTKVIDAVGGIELEITAGEAKYANMSIEEQNQLMNKNVPYLSHGGYQTLNGVQAVAWSRIRKLDSDYVRSSRQRTLAFALMTKISSYSKLQQMTLVEDMAGMFETNMTSVDLIRVGSSVLEILNNRTEYRMPADGMFTVQQNPWMMIVDWNKQIPELHQFIWGESK